MTLLFHVAQLQICGPVAAGICLDGREKEEGGRRVADTCLSQDEPAFVTRESGLAVGTGPRQI